MGGDESLVDDHPAGVLGSLDQQVGQRRDRHIRLVGAVQQVCKNSCLVLWKESEIFARNCERATGTSMWWFFSWRYIISDETPFLFAVLTVEMFLFWPNYLLCGGLAHCLGKTLKIILSHSQHFTANTSGMGTWIYIFLSMSQMFTWPARLCLAARILSLIVWPAADILNRPSDSETQQTC